MIHTVLHDEFDRVYQLLEASFPVEEYRPYPGQKALLGDPVYKIYADTESEGGEIRGILATWDLGDFLFLEHFAVDPSLRNRGIGSRFLKEVVKQTGKRAVLEVELPETELAKRRIAFYERNGFTLNRYPYEQPSLGPGRQAVPLWIMTSLGAIDPAEFKKIREALYRRVYKII